MDLEYLPRDCWDLKSWKSSDGMGLLSTEAKNLWAVELGFLVPQDERNLGLREVYRTPPVAVALQTL